MATRRTQLAGGELIQTDPDPLEVALKQAQIENLRNQPATEQAKIDAMRAETNRQWQALIQQGQIAKGQQTEESLYHAGTLAEARAARQANVEEAQRKLAEDMRYHTGTLGESAADREARINQAKDAIKAGQIGDIIHSLGPQLSSEPGKLAAVLAAYGDPAYGQAEKSFNEAQAKQKGEQLVANLGKGAKPEQVSALVAGTPTDVSNAAWNAYKAANPTVLGPPAAPATTAGATAPPPPTPQVRTEDRGLVNASMGLVGEGGKVLPIPGSTPGIDYTGGTQVAAALPPPVTTTPGQPNVAALTSAVNPPTKEEMGQPPAPALFKGVGGGSSYAAPQIDVDALLRSVVGGPTAEDLERRRRSAQPVAPTPFRY